MHLHCVCVFCHSEFCFGRCPQSLPVTGLCYDQTAIGNKLFDPFPNITFRDVWTGPFPVLQAANRKLLSDTLGNRPRAKEILLFRLAGFQNGIVDPFGLFFQPLAVFFVCQVKTFPAQICTKKRNVFAPDKSRCNSGI